MKAAFTSLAILALSAAAQADYIKKTVPLTSPPGQVVVGGYEGPIYVANGDKISVFGVDGNFVGLIKTIPVPHAYALAFSPLSGLYGSAVQNGVSQVWVITPAPAMPPLSCRSLPRRETASPRWQRILLAMRRSTWPTPATSGSTS